MSVAGSEVSVARRRLLFVKRCDGDDDGAHQRAGHGLVTRGLVREPGHRGWAFPRLHARATRATHRRRVVLAPLCHGEARERRVRSGNLPLW